MSNIGYGNHDAPLPGSAGNQGGSGDAKTRPDRDLAKSGKGHPDSRNEAPEKTPGDGAGPHGPQGNEVDPGAG